MKNIALVCFLAAMLLGCNNPSEEKKENLAHEESPHDFMFMQRAYPTGELKTDAYPAAIAWKKQLQASRSNMDIWEFVGPTNTGGRVTDIEIPIDDGATYYVGAASGGIFKTTDSGANWTPIFDDQEMLSIGDIEISKSDTDVIWVGTGEVNAGGGSLAYDGDGVYKSSDAGLTWESKGLPTVGSIGKVLIDPTDENTIFVAAMGPLFRDDSNRGVYRTIDGGTTWEQKLFISDITGIIDMAIHPTNGDIVYASAWQRVRRPQFREYGGATSGLHRSLDGGETWTEMTSGLPTAPSEKGRISIDISQSNPDVLYARYADATGSIQGVYRTANGGDSWQEVNSSQLTNVGFHWWFRGIFVDPTDENTIYNVDFEVQKSTDGGNSWSVPAFPDVHVDQHAMAFNTMVPGGVLLGNDGGLYYSNDDGASSVKDVTLPITQFYRFHVDAQNANKIYGGTQDNNTIRTVTGGSNDWDPIFGGDGFQPLVDFNNTDVIYCLSQNGNLGKSIDNGASFSNATSGISGGDRNNWDTPIAMDPNNSEVLYYGTQRVYQTTNAAGSWAAISPDLTNGPGGGNLSFGTIISIDISPANSDVIYAGTDDGNVWVTQDGGGNWANISTALPDRWVTRVKAHPTSADEVFVTFSGYRYGGIDGHVYHSADFGANWTDISTNLPDIPVNDVEFTTFEGIFLATDIGVLRSNTIGGNWEPYGTNMPSVVVTDLFHRYDDQYLYAATYGRSSYKVLVGELGVDDFSEENSVVVYPNPATTHISFSTSELSEEAEVRIYNQLGQLQLTSNIEGEMNISIESLSNGMYILQIRDGAKIRTAKFLKN